MTTTPNDPIDALRAERPDSPASSELARRVLDRALADDEQAAAPIPAPRPPRRTRRRLLRPAFALAAVAIAAGIAITANLADGPGLTGIDAARAEAIHTLRASEPRRFGLRITTYAGTDRRPANRSTLTAWDDDVHYVLGPTRSGAPGSADDGWERYEIDGVAYERPAGDDRRVVHTTWTRDPSQEDMVEDHGTFVLKGDALADLLVRLGGTTREVPGGGIEITVTGTAKQLAPVAAPEGANDDGRLGLYGLFDPIGDLASEVADTEPSARVRGTVRFDEQHRVVEVDAARLDTPDGSAVARRVVEVSYDVDELRAPDPHDVTLVHRPTWAGDAMPPVTAYGLQSERSAAQIVALAKRLRAQDQAALEGLETPASQGMEPGVADPRQGVEASWASATPAQLAADDRCAPIDPATGRPMRDAPADPAAVSWRCSAAGAQYTWDPPHSANG